MQQLYEKADRSLIHMHLKKNTTDFKDTFLNKKLREITFALSVSQINTLCTTMTGVKYTAVISGISAQTFHTPLFTLIDECNLMVLVTELESY